MISRENISDNTWLDLFFSKMETESFKESLFIMIVSTLSFSIFVIHHVFNDLGILFACLFIIVCSFMFMASSHVIVRSLRFASNINNLSEVIEAILGIGY